MNLKNYIWNHSDEFYLMQNQEDIFNKIKDFKLNGPIHIGGEEGNGKTFLARKLLNNESIYLPIHYNFDRYLLKNYSLIIVDNIINFHSEIISKLKRCIQHCRLLLIISENYSKSLNNDINAIIRRNIDLYPPDLEEINNLAHYLFEIFKIPYKNLPKNVNNLQKLIDFFDQIIIEKNE